MDSTTLLARLIEYETVNNPKEKIYPDLKIIEFLRDIIKQWNPKLKIKIFKKDNYESLYVTSQLEKSCDLLFMGHLDVVPVSKGWKSDPFRLKVEKGIAYGRGTKDCKGSVVSALLMLKKLCEDDNALLDKLGLFLSTDEETGGQYGAKIFFNYANTNNFLPKAVINVDGGPQVVHKRRAGFGVKINLPPKLIKIAGKRKKIKLETRVIGDNNRHSAYFVQGCDTHAVLALSKLLYLNQNWSIININGSWVKGNVIPDDITAEIAIKDDFNFSDTHITYDDHLTRILRRIKSLIFLNIKSNISSDFGISVNPNIISYSPKDGTEVHFDVRAFLNPSDINFLLNAFKEQLDDLNNVTTINCPSTSGFFYTSLDNSLVKIASSVLANFSEYHRPCEQEGASDARYASMHNVPVIDLGPKGGNIHGNDEFIILDSMNKFALIYEEIANQLLEKKFENSKY